jgi:hypothetical protein
MVYALRIYAPAILKGVIVSMLDAGRGRIIDL